jgi:CDP-diacylglycerol--glycerol-3-phosphate 3-phosphatidyltransferase
MPVGVASSRGSLSAPDMTAFGPPSVLAVVLLFALPAFWVVSFLVFLVRIARWGRPRIPRLEQVPRSPYLPRILMEFGYWMFTIPVAICLRLGVTPNVLTASSLPCTLAAAIAFALGYFALGGWILLFAFTLDAWYGIVARQTGTASPCGEFLDATVDRYKDLIAFLGLMYYYRHDSLPLFLAAAALVGSTLVSYTRAKGEAVGVDPNVGWMQRHERAVYLSASTVLAPIAASFLEPGAEHPRYHLVVAALGLVALATNITAVWRVRFVVSALHAQREGARGAEEERRPRRRAAR